jgi:type II secretory pathway predicted ATPase ExeA
MEDSRNYLRHRLKVAGHPTGELFEADAIERAYQVTLGVPRELNRMAKLSLEFAWVKEYPLVSLKAVEAVVRDLQRHQNLPKA